MTASRWTPPDRDTFVRATGEIALSGAIAALTWSAILAWRLSGHDSAHGLLYSWVPLTAMALPVATALVLTLRVARHGASVLWPDSRHLERGTTLFAITSVFGVAGWFVLGYGLSAFTHHRGLGATTFAFLGAGWLSVSSLVAYRLTALIHRSAYAMLLSRFAALVASVVVVGLLALLAKASRGTGMDTSYAFAHVVFDAMILAALAVVTARVRLRNVNLRFTVPAILGVVVLQFAIGVATLHRLVQVTPIVAVQTRIVTPLVHLLGNPDTRPKHVRKAVLH